MPTSHKFTIVAQALRKEVWSVKSRARRLRLRTLLGRFGYSKRSDDNTSEITHLLGEAGIAVNPPIVRFGERWGLSIEDWIVLSDAAALTAQSLPTSGASATWQADEWFERIQKTELRTEKEVEIKFIVPLLSRLGLCRRRSLRRHAGAGRAWLQRNRADY